MIAYFDASALIYLIEGKPPFFDRVRTALMRVEKRHPGIGSALSRLSWLECRVGPMRSNDSARLAAFDAVFLRPDLVWIELSRDVVELAAAVQVRHGLRTPDALQAACCLQLGRDHLMLTRDADFQRVAGLNVLLLTE